MALPPKIAGFTVLPILYSKSTKHYLYVREHVSKSHSDQVDPLPSGRTLFVVNIPPDSTERELTLFFKTCGHVERVAFQQDVWATEDFGPMMDDEDESEDEEDEENEGENEGEEAAEEEEEDESMNPRKRRRLRKKLKENMPPHVTPLPQPELPLRIFRHTGSSAHVIFADSSSISRALSLPPSSSDQRKWPPTTGTIAPSGLAHYIALYDAQRPPLTAVKAHADTYADVFEYNKALTAQKSKYKKGEAIVDEDGFTMVTRGGAYGQTLGGGVGVASKSFHKDARSGAGEKAGKRGKKKTKKHEKDNFYRFQVHEHRRRELVDLKKEFQKDVEKIEKLKESKRYKPY
ncbi:hypothetical protein M422DRAFT_23236 [Sphaerobolus stellatus SS14]|nr:hypothetical protein M422DRAFT_23236 [Sphaerobolus stellatus SS14]